MSSSTDTGRTAEGHAADYLAARGHIIVERNWRNRWCELDLITHQAGIVHIVEVKYRRTTAYGHAAEYVNAAKLQRLRRAALAWAQAHGYEGAYQIDVIGVEGPLGRSQIQYLPNVSNT